MSDLYQKVTIDEKFEEDLKAWLTEKAHEYGLRFMLAHAHDGVIWGRIDEESDLIISGEVFDEVAVALRLPTLQQARLFGPAGELLIWRTGAGFSARMIADGEQGAANTFQEKHWLWGEGMESKTGFTLMHEGREGLRHAPPVENAKGARVELLVRHYIDYDEYGQAYIANSRLVDLKTNWEAKWH
jgi:CRISPR-associated protein (TIGR03984 family)